MNRFGRILTKFTGLLRTNTVAAKRDLLTERTGLGKSVSVSLRNPLHRIEILIEILSTKKFFRPKPATP